MNDLYRYACSLCNDPDLSFDLVQQCCEKLLKHKKPVINIEKYAMTILRNVYIDNYRRKKLELVVDSKLNQQNELNEQDIVKDLESCLIDEQQITIILEKLDDAERELVFLWAVQELSMSEIAKVMNLPRGTVLSKMHRLRKRLKHQFPQFLQETPEYG